MKKYTYRINPAFPLFFLGIMILIPFSHGFYEIYFNPGFISLAAAIIILPVIWYKSKFMIISDEKIQLIIFGKLVYREIRIKDMEEASELGGGGYSSSATDAFRPFSAPNWISIRYYSPNIKVIITNEEALYLNTRAIKNGHELFVFLRKHVGFVR